MVRLSSDIAFVKPDDRTLVATMTASPFTTTTIFPHRISHRFDLDLGSSKKMYPSSSGRVMMHRMLANVAASPSYSHHGTRYSVVVGSLRHRLLSSPQSHCVKQQQQQQFSSSSSQSSPPPSSSSSSSTMMWQVGTAAALVLTYVGVNTAMNYSSGISPTDEFGDEVGSPGT
jgi:hypothetical protein